MRASRCTRTSYHGEGPGETSPLPSEEAPGPPGAQTAEPYGNTSLPASSHQVGRAPGLRTILDQIQDLLPNLTSSYLYSPLLCHIPSCTSALSLLGVSDLHSSLHRSFKTIHVTLPIAPCSPRTHSPCPSGSFKGNVQDRGLGRDLSIYSQGSHTPMDRMGMMQKLV